jgi:hypothetical protein
MFEISQYDNEQRYQIILWEKFTTDINELDYERFLKSKTTSKEQIRRTSVDNKWQHSPER